MTKRIVLCADDYGQAEAISKGILELLAVDRLTAVSCLVTSPDWRTHATWLQPYKEKADIGVHLNFTDGVPLSAAYREQIGATFMPLSRLLWHTMTRSKLLHRAALAAEVEAQLEAFTAAVGSAPRFIDGHQHVHHLPVIREVLLDVYRRKLASNAVYMRAVTQMGTLLGLKKLVIHCTGGADFAAQLDSLRVAPNTSFAVIYPFNQSRRYRQYCQEFLRVSSDRGLIMCHPGLATNDQKDPLNQSRCAEYS